MTVKRKLPKKPTSVKATKEEIVSLATQIIERADKDGILDDLCDEGQELVSKLKGILGLSSTVPEYEFRINTCDFETLNFDPGLFDVKVFYDGKEIPSEIFDYFES
jgi:hypothetical protein